MSKNIYVDVDKDGSPLGLEILFAKHTLATEDITSATINIARPPQPALPGYTVEPKYNQIVMDAKHHIFFLHKPYGMYIKAAFCLVFALAGGLMAATGLLTPNNNAFGWSPTTLFLFGLGACLLCLAFTFFFYAQARYTRLVITLHDIAYHAPGYSLYAPWENVAAIKRIPRLDIGEGLTLHEATAVYNPPQSLNTLAPPYDRFIPLMGFGWQWEEQEIGRLLKMYKPSLFVAEIDTPTHQQV